MRCPSPPLPPVTSATAPFRSMMLLPSFASALGPGAAHVDEPPGIRHLADGDLDHRGARPLDRGADLVLELGRRGGADAGRAEQRRKLGEIGIVQLARDYLV